MIDDELDDEEYTNLIACNDNLYHITENNMMTCLACGVSAFYRPDENTCVFCTAHNGLIPKK